MTVTTVSQFFLFFQKITIRSVTLLRKIDITFLLLHFITVGYEAFCMIYDSYIGIYFQVVQVVVIE